jgi:hypothetical protein
MCNSAAADIGIHSPAVSPSNSIFYLFRCSGQGPLSLSPSVKLPEIHLSISIRFPHRVNFTPYRSMWPPLITVRWRFDQHVPSRFTSILPLARVQVPSSPTCNWIYMVSFNSSFSGRSDRSCDWLAPMARPNFPRAPRPRGRNFFAPC